MLRCASKLVTATYLQVRLIPHILRALPTELLPTVGALGTNPSYFTLIFHLLRVRQSP
jgi:hypothetical protein